MKNNACFFLQYVFIISAMKLNTKKIETERKRAGLTKSAFSEKIGMSVSAYCRMLDGKSTKIKTIVRIAHILHYDPKDLLTN